MAREHERAAPVTLAVGDPPQGIAALARDADGTLRFAGGEFTDEQDVVAPVGQERAVATAVAAWIADDAPRRVRLEFVPEDAPTLGAMTTVLGARGYRVERIGSRTRNGARRSIAFFRCTGSRAARKPPS